MTTSFTNGTKHTSTFSSATKNISSYMTYLRHGHQPLVGDTNDNQDLGDRTFDDPAFMEGGTLANVTFDQLTDQVWSNATKH
jgi:hypothetical protein